MAVTSAIDRAVAAPTRTLRARAARKLRHLSLPAVARVRRQPGILCYHRVAVEHSDPWALCVHPDNFAAQMGALRQSGRPVLAVAELAARLADGTAPKGAVAVTFDDGYLDNLDTAVPILERHEVPATVFVTTSAVGGDGSLWWDELGDLLLTPGSPGVSAHLEVGGGIDLELPAAGPDLPRWHAGQADPPTPRHAAYLVLWRALVAMAAPERRRALDELSAVLGRPARRRRMLDEDQLRILDAHPLVEIGAHTVTHPSLPTLDAEGVRDEIEGGRAQLEGLLGHPVRLLAYPFGHHDDATVAAARRAGFEAAVTTAGGAVGRTPDPHRIPRETMFDFDAARFRAELRRLG